jgi:hypothetical protein
MPRRMEDSECGEMIKIRHPSIIRTMDFVGKILLSRSGPGPTNVMHRALRHPRLRSVMERYEHINH